MSISGHMEEWGGLPVYAFPPPGEEPAGPLPEPDSVAWRVSADFWESDEEWPAAFARFAAAVDLTRVRSLIVGTWSECAERIGEYVLDVLLPAADRMPELRALFLGDMTCEESEISWIEQADVAPVLEAFPLLEEFGVRGGSGLVFPPLRHAALRRLRIETGGLSREVVRTVGACDFPALEDLDIWLGTSWYGADTQPADLEPFMTGSRLPALRRLALRNSDIQNEIATALAGAPVVARLRELDLSMGTLGDEGALALLDGQPLTHLRKLDLHHHFISEPVALRIEEALAPHGVEVDLGHRQSTRSRRDGRYTAVAE
ncbi:STM4015 family protein [Streptomyces globosus]|uniref:STM4015 family protein n=1 Tax=Streptomyces globosus TaxID=68209 RepID=UPI00382977AD